MKKGCLTFILILLSFIPISAHNLNIDRVLEPDFRCTVPKTAKSDKDFACLKGNVHIVKSEFAVFVYQDGKYVKGAVSATTIITFDTQGNLVERLSLGSKDYGTESSMDKVTYNFNSQGVATGWEEYNPVGVPPSVKSIYSFDNKGNRIKETVNYSTQQAILIHIYDAKGKNIEDRQYYPVPIANDNEKTSNVDERYLERFTKYKYDGKNLIETDFYDKAGLITGKTVFSYDKNQNKKEVIVYSMSNNGDQARVNRVTFKYDNQGNMIEKVIYNKDDSIQNKYIYGFNEKGYRISEIDYDSECKTKGKISITYEVDSQGNWLSYTTDALPNVPEPYPMEIRTITYY